MTASGSTPIGWRRASCFAAPRRWASARNCSPCGATEVIDPLVALTIAGSLSALFATSVAHQLSSVSEWTAVVRNYRLIPDVLVRPVAGLLLFAQTLTAAALIWTPTRSAAACAAASLLVAFGAAMWIN